MKELAERTLGLLKRHPILWLPQLCAVLLGVALGAADHSANRFIVDRLIHFHRETYQPQPGLEFPDDPPPPPTDATIAKLEALEIPMLLLSDFLRGTAFFVALVVLANLVSGGGTLAANPRREVWRSVQRKSQQIRNASLIAIALHTCKVLLALAGWAILRSKPDWQYAPFWHFQAVNWASSLALLAAVIYLLVPRMLCLASRQQLPHFSSREVLSARIVAIIVVMVWIGLESSLSPAFSVLLRHQSESTYIWFNLLQWLDPVITAASVTIASIAFSVIAQMRDNSEIFPIQNVV